MFGHVREERLLEVVEGTAPAAAREHVARCEACGARVAEAAAAWALAAESGVPEPAPLYWDAFRRQVSRRIEGESGGRRWRSLRWLSLAAAAGILVALSLLGPSRSPAPGASVGAVPVLPAWSALPSAEEDDGLEVLRAVAASSESDLVTGFERSGVQEMLLDLSDEESRALAERLRADESKGGAL